MNGVGMGTVLMSMMRDRLAHSCGSLITIDAQNGSEPFHLLMSEVQDGKRQLFVDACRLYDDYRKALKLYFVEIAGDQVLLDSCVKGLVNHEKMLERSQDYMDDIFRAKVSIEGKTHPEYPFQTDHAFRKLRVLVQADNGQDWYSFRLLVGMT
jgi:hypothetical protein